MRFRKRTRRVIGLIPWLGRQLVGVWRWMLRSPQPFVFCAFFVGVAWALWVYAQRADAFRIASVTLPPQSALTLPRPIIGENLWGLDLRALSAQLHRQQPWLKDVRVIRQLPNAVRIETIARRPVVQVKLDRWYPVDGEGFILPQGTAEPDERLVQLVGLDRSGAMPKVGKDNADARLKLGLRAFEIITRAPRAIARRITAVNVSDPQEIRLTMDREIEVRCGSEVELAAHLERLRATLKAIAKQPFAVGYIDVRFREPVVGPRVS